MKKLSLILLFAPLLTATVIAGRIWTTRCSDCEHTDEFIHGGAIRVGMVHGACGNCRRIVSLSWRRREGGEPPKPIASVWDPMRNRPVLIFNCPHCEGHFMKIDNVKEELQHCAKCQKENVELVPGPSAD